MSSVMRVVYDVNVLFSWVGWRGVPYRCVEAAREIELVESISCEAILNTFAEKLRLKLGFEENQVVDALTDFLSFTTLISLPDTIPTVSGDAEDDGVIACAVAAQAEYIVSGDKRHLLPLREYQQTRIVSPAEFLTVIRQG